MSFADSNTVPAQSREWLVGGGEMGELTRTTDWSSSPLGPRERWSPSMRTVVNLLLESRVPMALLWGRELILLYNDAYRVIAADKHPRAFGRSTREIWREVWHINEPIFKAVLERGESIYLEDELFPIERDGRREDAYFTLCYSPVRGLDGAVVGSLVTLLETTGRVRQYRALESERERAEAAAERERELLARVIERIPVMVTIYDPALRSFHLNEELRRVLGWTDEDAREGDLMTLCYPDPGYREEVRRFMESPESGWREFEVMSKRGHKVESAWANVRLPDDTRVGIGIDLRERKQAEAELKRALEEAEVGKQLLESLMEKLREADRRKDEFLAVLSHELRNPLAPIRNSLYVLDRAEPGSGQAARAKAVIERQVDQLTRLVADLLDVSRIRRGKVRLRRERVDLAEVVAKVLEDHRSVFVARGIELRTEQLGRPVWVDGDAIRLGQALGNLLHNAAKFTDAGGSVTVALNQEGSTAVLEVADTGAGMTVEMLDQLFEPFTQADQTLDRSGGGLGLGLALVKGLIELHGGTVGACSEGTGLGSRFTLRIPAVAEPAPALHFDAEPARTGARRVLVIEDNVDAAASLKDVLELEGHEVRLAYSGAEGIEKARKFRPDVVLCDIGLPGMDGYEVARSFRADDELQTIPLVALTGYALAEDQTKAKKAGFDRHIAKPPDLDLLERILAELPRRDAA